MSTYLQRRISLTSPNSGRILSTEFMELPSKKVWPGYYQQIQHPRCISAIQVSSRSIHLSSMLMSSQKQVKRKEYESVSDFAADMELVFSNAMQFNVEHTQIWEDALTLRVC